jgi:hypothetical protein
MLKAIVDETSHGKYDFMYLRIGESALGLEVNSLADPLDQDFANNCKYDIPAVYSPQLPFFLTIMSQRWLCFHKL